MSESASRDRDIDLVKGIACLTMVMGHTGFYLGYSAQTPPSWKALWITAEASVALFFLATGMNVFHYAKGSEKKKGFGPTKNYLITCVALFICGLAYNLNRQTVGLMDLFQGIAAAMLVTYIPLRRNWPSWAIGIIAVLLIGIAFSYSMTPDDSIIKSGYIRISAYEFQESLKVGAAHPDLLGKYISTMAELRSLPILDRFLFVHFSVLPWSACALLGALVMRHARTRWEAVLWVVFAASLLYSFTFPFFKGLNLVDFFYRGKADYVFRHIGTGGLTILAARRWYQGKNRVGRWVEFIGRESFLVFISQWILIEMYTNFVHPAKAGLAPLIPSVALIYWLMTVFAKYFAKKRDAGIDSMSYAKKWFAILIVCSGLAAYIHFGLNWPRHANINLAHLFSYVGALAFAMAFPSLKTIMKGGGKKTKPQPKADAAAETP